MTLVAAYCALFHNLLQVTISLVSLIMVSCCWRSLDVQVVHFGLFPLKFFGSKAASGFALKRIFFKSHARITSRESVIMCTCACVGFIRVFFSCVQKTLTSRSLILWDLACLYLQAVAIQMLGQLPSLCARWTGRLLHCLILNTIPPELCTCYQVITLLPWTSPWDWANVRWSKCLSQVTWLKQGITDTTFH